MHKNYFHTTQDLLDQSPSILNRSKDIHPTPASDLCQILYQIPKKDKPALIDFHYQHCDESSEFADHVIELLEIALDESQDIKFLKSLSFWGDKEKARRFKRRTDYALAYL